MNETRGFVNTQTETERGGEGGGKRERESANRVQTHNVFQVFDQNGEFEVSVGHEELDLRPGVCQNSVES